MGEAGKQATLSPVPIFPAGGFTKTGKPQLKPLATEVRVRGLDGRGALTLTVAALREGSKGFTLTLEEAAAAMHISETTLKSARGELGIREWPQRVHTCYNTLKERYTQKIKDLLKRGTTPAAKEAHELQARITFMDAWWADVVARPTGRDFRAEAAFRDHLKPWSVKGNKEEHRNKKKEAGATGRHAAPAGTPGEGRADAKRAGTADGAGALGAGKRRVGGAEARRQVGKDGGWEAEGSSGAGGTDSDGSSGSGAARDSGGYGTAHGDAGARPGVAEAGSARRPVSLRLAARKRVRQSEGGDQEVQQQQLLQEQEQEQHHADQGVPQKRLRTSRSPADDLVQAAPAPATGDSICAAPASVEGTAAAGRPVATETAAAAAAAAAGAVPSHAGWPAGVQAPSLLAMEDSTRTAAAAADAVYDETVAMAAATLLPVADTAHGTVSLPPPAEPLHALTPPGGTEAGARLAAAAAHDGEAQTPPARCGSGPAPAGPPQTGMPDMCPDAHMQVASSGYNTGGHGSGGAAAEGTPLVDGHSNAKAAAAAAPPCCCSVCTGHRLAAAAAVLRSQAAVASPEGSGVGYHYRYYSDIAARACGYAAAAVAAEAEAGVGPTCAAGRGRCASAAAAEAVPGAAVALGAPVGPGDTSPASGPAVGLMGTACGAATSGGVGEAPSGVASGLAHGLADVGAAQEAPRPHSALPPPPPMQDTPPVQLPLALAPGGGAQVVPLPLPASAWPPMPPPQQPHVFASGETRHVVVNGLLVLITMLPLAAVQL